MHLVELAEDYDGIKKEPSSRSLCLPCRRCAFKVNLSRPLCICLAYCAKRRRGLAQFAGGGRPPLCCVPISIFWLGP